MSSDLDERNRSIADDTSDDDEEIPRPVLIAIVSIAIILAILALTIGGGHQHLH